MAAFTVYKIDEDWQTVVYLYMNCKYVLNDGILLTTLQTRSWCRTCRTVVAGEVVPSLQEIEEEIRRWTDPNDEIHKRFPRVIIEEAISEFQLLMQWLPTRISDPRCLECQSTDMVEISGHNFVDPVSGTRIRFLSAGHIAKGVETRRRLTPEGLLIEKTVEKGLFDI